MGEYDRSKILCSVQIDRFDNQSVSYELIHFKSTQEGCEIDIISNYEIPNVITKYPLRKDIYFTDFHKNVDA